MTVVFVVFMVVVIASAVLCALCLDGVLPRTPLDRLANFPFRNRPATNGLIFGAVVFDLPILVLTWVSSTG